MNCETIAKQLAFDCTRLDGVHGEIVFELGTPFSFADGTAICVYVVDRAPLAEITDDALTLHHLSSLGLEPWSPRRLSVLRDQVSPYGVTFSDSGALCMLGAADTLAWQIPRFISAELAVSRWAQDQLRST